MTQMLDWPARSYGDSAAVAVRAAIEALDALSNPGLGAAMLDAAPRRSAAAGSVVADRSGSAGQVHNQTLTGMATYYDLPGSKTASGQVFDRSGLNAAMTSERFAIGTKVRVQLQSDPSRSIDVIVNDARPFARDANGRPMHPLRSDPNIVIDLTPRAFRELTGNLSLGRVSVIITVLEQ